MLADRARIFVAGGAGGNGVVSFRREAHVPKGGPDGGDGGRGGDVALVVDPSLRDLAAFKRGSHFKAARGGHGQGANKHGATPTGSTCACRPGTVVVDPERGDRWDLTAAGPARAGRPRRQRRTRQPPLRHGHPPGAPLRREGPAGRGALAHARAQAARRRGPGRPAERRQSSLLAALTRAQPKVADYPFTTLEPVLGTLERDDRQLVLADIPGLIEGASAAPASATSSSPTSSAAACSCTCSTWRRSTARTRSTNHATVEAELHEHGHGLAGLPRILCLSKADLVPPAEPRPPCATGSSAWRRRCWRPRRPPAPACRSCATRSSSACRPTSRPGRRPSSPPRTASTGRGRASRSPSSAWAPGAFRVEGGRIERLVARHDVDNDDALRYVEERLRALGVIKELQAAGFEPGDDVQIAGIVFELDPGAPLG